MVEDVRYQRFNLRVPRELLDRLEQAADAHSHSTNAEIVARLEESFEQGGSRDRLLVVIDGLDAMQGKMKTLNEYLNSLMENMNIIKRPIFIHASEMVISNTTDANEDVIAESQLKHSQSPTDTTTKTEKRRSSIKNES